jgi:hypothetical protein
VGSGSAAKRRFGCGQLLIFLFPPLLIRRIYASVEESQKGDKRGSITLHIRGLDIKNVEPGIMGLGRSDPFFELARKNADHATGVVRATAELIEAYRS